MLAGIGAEVLALGHTMPVFGAGRDSEMLTRTRVAMRHTGDGMNAGRSVDDIAASVKQPPRLDALPRLAEFCERASWSARASAKGILGWKDGNPTNLGTLSSAARARHIARLAGGTDLLSEPALRTDDLKFRPEGCDHLTALGEPVQHLKADTLAALAETAINATARNTFPWGAGRPRETEISE